MLVGSWKTLFLENGSNDFLETLHDVRHQKVKKSDTAGFFEKWLDHPISRKTCIFEGFFEIFSETTLTILVLKRQNVEENDTEQTQKTGHQNLYPFSRYLSSKFFIDGPKSSFSAISWPI